MSKEYLQEGDRVSTTDLIKNWERILEFYDHLIGQGFQLRPIRFLVRYIIDQDHSKKLYGGTSLYDLLISLPTDNKIDYTRTLKVKYNQLTQIAEFNYRNKPGNEMKKGKYDWSAECQATEVVDTFEYFLKEHDDWREITK